MTSPVLGGYQDGRKVDDRGDDGMERRGGLIGWMFIARRLSAVSALGKVCMVEVWLRQDSFREFCFWELFFRLGGCKTFGR